MGMEKAALRRQILKNRNAILPEQKRLWDQEIFRQLVQYDEKSPCPVYLCYVSYKSEVSTKEFILWCIKKDKTVFVPKVTDNTDMEFYRITAWEDLKAGYQGIMEPDVLPERSFSGWITESGFFSQSDGVCRAASAEGENGAGKIETAKKIRMLLPGAVFDGQGNRIGYGGGFYDRWLARWDQSAYARQAALEKIGLAYRIQMVGSIPAEKFDQKVDCVITDNRRK